MKARATGFLIAWGIMSWPTTAGKARSYRATRWIGQRPDGPFDTAGGDDAWAQTVEQLKQEDARERMRRLEKKQEKIGREINRIRKDL